jgi:hypothetical protein
LTDQLFKSSTDAPSRKMARLFVPTIDPTAVPTTGVESRTGAVAVLRGRLRYYRI